MRSLTQRARTIAASVAGSLDELARIGAGADGGVTRPPWSPELFDAYGWVERQMLDPAAMLFVPSCRGLSHSPAEFTSAEHVEIGSLVLANLLRERLGDR